MFNSAAGAILFLAGAQMSAPMQPVETNHHHYAKDTIVSGSAATALFALASGLAAVSVYRMTDETMEFYPLQASFNTGGARLGDALSVHRGGMRFSFTALRAPKVNSFSNAPDYRKEARNMAKAMPGYPQPARIVIGLKVNY